jgi:hypothetical protein
MNVHKYNKLISTFSDLCECYVTAHHLDKFYTELIESKRNCNFENYTSLIIAFEEALKQFISIHELRDLYRTSAYSESNSVNISDKLVIIVTGTNVEPYSKNWKECYDTWVPELKDLGYTVLISVGNPDMECDYELFGDIIHFKCDDTKMGLYDKSIRMPIEWILGETDYHYYLRIDSDSFVHPERFNTMIHDNFGDYGHINYMGCCIPYKGWNPNNAFKTMIQESGLFASGCAYMVSRYAMAIAHRDMRVEKLEYFGYDDWVLGRAMWENKIPLLHDSRIFFESSKTKMTTGLGVPYDISEPESHFAIQHHMNGRMSSIMQSIGYGT